MSDKQNNKKETEKENVQQKEKSIFETIKEVNQKEKMEKMQRMAQQQKEIHEKEEKERENYASKLMQDKVELIKIKQGVSDKGISVQEEEKKNYTLKEKIGNFFYHNKLWIIMFVVFGGMIGFMVHDYATKDNPDMTVMVLVDDYELSLRTEKIEAIMNEYIEDVNENGEAHVTVYYMPVSEDLDPYTLQANSTKFFALMQDGETMMVIADPVIAQRLIPEQTLEDLSEHFPENENVKDYGFYLSGTDFAKEIEYPEKFSDDIYIGIRKVKEGLKYTDEMQKNYDIAYKVLEKLIERYSK
ncbi:MAG: hypothetical protein IJP18_06585 [Oscillospiraceae bacterium]|nr:hypothetical protein [Oscillospiraceae bacterium]